MSPASLIAVADWNAEKGCTAFRQSHYEKNHDRCAALLDTFARHIHTADHLRRLAWMIEHSSEANRRKK